MKTKTLKERAFAYGLDSKDDCEAIFFIDTYNKRTVAMIDEEKMYGIYLYNTFYDLPEESQKELNEIFYKYAKTPLGERTDRYYLKHKWIGEDGANYLNLYKGDFEIYSQIEHADYQTKFTKAEVEEIKKRFNTDLKEFEIIEVEE